MSAKTTMEILAGRLAMQRGCVFLLDPLSSKLKIVAAYGLTREEIQPGKYRIGELPLNLQVKLLRVLQERVFERIGSSESITFDVRVVAATHRNLMEEVIKGTFREDLFWRLNVVPIVLPPLSMRGDQILIFDFRPAELPKKHKSRFDRISLIPFLMQANTPLLVDAYAKSARSARSRLSAWFSKFILHSDKFQ